MTSSDRKSFKVPKKMWFFRLIGIILFVVILTRIDLNAALRTLATVDLRFVGLAIAIQGAALFVSTFRWQIIMGQLDIFNSFWRSFLQQLIGTAAAILTPGQLGEFVKAVYLHDEGNPFPESILSIAIDRIFDLLMLLLFGFISLAILFGLPSRLTFIIASITSLFFGAGFFLLRKQEKSAQIIAKSLTRLSPNAYKETVQESAYRLTFKISQFSYRAVLTAGLLTILNYVLLLFRIYSLVLALHLVIPLSYFIMAVPLLRLVGLVPISVLGIGTRDITAIYLYGRVGIPPSSVIILTTLGLFTLQIQTLVGLLVSWRYPPVSSTDNISLQQSLQQELTKND